MTGETLSFAKPPRPIPALVAWGTWPLAFMATLAAINHAKDFGFSIAAATGLATGIAALAILAIETLWPARREWAMTWRSFVFRDLKYFALGGGTIAATNFLLAAVGISLATNNHGWGSQLPLLISVPLGMFCVDFLQYWQHRISHRSSSWAGRFLWKAHVAHHLPEQVYVLMHPAGHPINGFIVRGLVTIVPLYLLGLSAEAVASVNALIGLQGLISHSNADFRAGWFNYIFVGAELHRYHHSADPQDEGNYAAALAVLDVIFGTHVYRPGQLPERLGVYEPEAYPKSAAVLSVLALPFR